MQVKQAGFDDIFPTPLAVATIQKEIMPKLEVRAQGIKEKNEMAHYYKDISKSGSLLLQKRIPSLIFSPPVINKLMINVDNAEVLEEEEKEED